MTFQVPLGSVTIEHRPIEHPGQGDRFALRRRRLQVDLCRQVHLSDEPIVRVDVGELGVASGSHDSNGSVARDRAGELFVLHAHPVHPTGQGSSRDQTLQRRSAILTRGGVRLHERCSGPSHPRLDHGLTARQVCLICRCSGPLDDGRAGAQCQHRQRHQHHGPSHRARVYGGILPGGGVGRAAAGGLRTARGKSGPTGQGAGESQAGATSRTGQQRTDRLARLGPDGARVKRCGKSAPARRVTGAAGNPHPEQGRTGSDRGWPARAAG